MGEVYQATDSKLGRSVAIKLLPEAFTHDQDRAARFEREARVLASLNHPNIAAIYGVEESGGRKFLVMELVGGETLAERISRSQISVEETLGIAVQITEALEGAHEKGVVHRDLKPANIKITSEGKVKVLDFGLAKAFAADVDTSNLSNSPTLSMAATNAGIIIGTAAYMSPEQARGKTVDRRADVWAFGAVLYEMLTGKQAFHGEDVTEILAAVVMKEPSFEALPGKTPGPIRNLLRRCLEKNQKRRLQHIGEARIVIEDALAGATHPELLPAAQNQRVFGWTAAGVIAVLLLALATVSFVHFRETPAQRPRLRLLMATPEKLAISMFSLSPNGSSLVFVAREGGQNRLWIRSLDSLQAQVMPGTEDAAYPFWSPESAFIGFFAHGSLKKIAVAGGPPVTLCAAASGRGGAWNRDGVILFAPNIVGGLFRVSEGGGSPVAVTKLASDGNTTDSHRHPEFLPDGNRFVYLYESGKEEIEGIYEGSLDGASPSRILPDASNAVYVPPAERGGSGYLLFRREGTLMAQPFDPERRQTTGNMVPVAEQVGNLSATLGAFSASENGVLAYQSGGTIGNRELTWTDRMGTRLDLATKPAAINSAAIAPDGNRIAFGIFDSTGGDIWLQDLVRGVMSKFTFGPEYSTAPVWSSDSARIAFTLRSPRNGWAIYQKSMTGSDNGELLSRTGSNAYPWDWSQDGKFIAYSDYADKTHYDLWLLPLMGEHKPISYLQTRFNETHAQFSPDGRWMAYVSDESGQPQVYVQAIPANGERRTISTAGGDLPRWRQDGKELYYIAADQKLTAIQVKTGSAPSAPFESGPPQPLFIVEPLGGATPIISRYPYQPAVDGRRFLVNVHAGGEAASAPPITVLVNWEDGLKK